MEVCGQWHLKVRDLFSYVNEPVVKDECISVTDPELITLSTTKPLNTNLD